MARRLLRHLGVHARLDVILLTRSPRLFATWLVSELLSYVIGMAAILLLAISFGGIGRWSTMQLTFMLAYGLTVNGVSQTFFGYNVSMISRRIGRGQLDHTLLQPQPMWMSLATEGFAPAQSIQRFLPGAALMAYSWMKLGLPIWPRILLCAVSVPASAAIELALSYAIGSAAFWAPRGAEELSPRASSLGEVRTFPLDGTRGVLRGALLTAVPAGLVAWWPSRALVGLDRRPWAGAVTPLAAVVAASVAVLVFRKGVKHYGRTGSQRYTPFGHRR